MNNRERFKAVMAFEPVDRLPELEIYWWWDKTLERWHNEGLPAELTEHGDVARYLGLDVHRIFWPRALSRFVPPAGFQPKHGRGLIESEQDYEDYVQPIFAAPSFDEAAGTPVFNPAMLETYAAEQGRGEVFLWLQLDGFFWFPRCVFGIEPHLYAFYDQPKLMHRMNRDLAEYTLRLLNDLSKFFKPDLVSIAEDMSYNHGPMLSKDLFDEFLAPYYLQVVPAIEDMGAIPIVDSDGDIQNLIPWLEDVGIEGITPLERMAGNDTGGGTHTTGVRTAHARHAKRRLLCFVRSPDPSGGIAGRLPPVCLAVERVL